MFMTSSMSVTICEKLSNCHRIFIIIILYLCIAVNLPLEVCVLLYGFLCIFSAYLQKSSDYLTWHCYTTVWVEFRGKTTRWRKVISNGIFIPLTTFCRIILNPWAYLGVYKRFSGSNILFCWKIKMIMTSRKGHDSKNHS